MMLRYALQAAEAGCWLSLDAWRHLLAVVCGCVCLLGCLSNLSTANILYIHPSRTSIGLCLGSLVVASLLTCTLDGGCLLLELLYTGTDPGPWLPALLPGVSLFTRCLTAAMFTALTTDRLVAMVMPKKYEAYLGRTQTATMLGLLWMASGLLGTVKSVLVHDQVSGDPSRAPSGVLWRWEAAEMLLVLLLPLVCVAAMAGCVGLALAAFYRSSKLSLHQHLKLGRSERLLRCIGRHRPALTDVRGSRALMGVIAAQCGLWAAEGVCSTVWLVRGDVYCYMARVVLHYLAPLLTSAVLLISSPTFRSKLPVCSRARNSGQVSPSPDVYVFPNLPDASLRFRSLHGFTPRPQPRPCSHSAFPHSNNSSGSDDRKLSGLTTLLKVQGMTDETLTVEDGGTESRRRSLTSMVSVGRAEEEDIFVPTMVHVGAERLNNIHVRNSLQNFGRSISTSSDITICSPIISRPHREAKSCSLSVTSMNSFGETSPTGAKKLRVSQSSCSNMVFTITMTHDSQCDSPAMCTTASPCHAKPETGIHTKEESRNNARTSMTTTCGPLFNEEAGAAYRKHTLPEPSI